MKKNFVLILMSALLVFALAACGQTASEPDAPQNGMEGAVSSATPDTQDDQPAPKTSEDAAGKPTASKTLVAYFSRADENYDVGVVEKGNTEIIAEMIADEVGADTFRIQTVAAYPESYDECTAIAKQEREQGARPELSSTIANFDDYDEIYLGYPIWYGDMPMVVYTFLESYNFAGKTIIPFCTHGGSGLAGTVGSIQAACSGAAVLDGLAIAGTTAQNDPEDARDAVRMWLSPS